MAALNTSRLYADAAADLHAACSYVCQRLCANDSMHNDLWHNQLDAREPVTKIMLFLYRTAAALSTTRDEAADADIASRSAYINNRLYTENERNNVVFTFTENARRRHRFDLIWEQSLTCGCSVVLSNF